MHYRRDVDGLRAVAVLSVIFFHAGFKGFEGGFVGVDIFFVISGFLITRIILDELNAGGFSFLAFYERRARRILPALFFVMFVCAIFSYHWMMPDELENFGQSLTATALFSNNVLLTLTTGYWDLASEFKPLLHTWSLGVEEQYYIIVPVLLLASCRYARPHISKILVAIFVASFVAAVFYGIKSPNANFYLLPSRAWELLAGSLAAFYVRREIQAQPGVWGRQLGDLGFILIVSSVFLIDTKSSWPNCYTVIPVLGAVLVLVFAATGSVSHAILSNRFMVGMGLISYSAYLWHWPLFVFARIYSVDRPGFNVMLALTLVSIGLAYLTWKYIENPFRDKRRFSRAVIVSLASVFSFAFAAYGYFLHHERGLPARVFERHQVERGAMHIEYNERIYKYISDDFVFNGRPRILILGNSYARDFANVLIERFGAESIDLVYRNDVRGCIDVGLKGGLEKLLHGADAIIISGDKIEYECLGRNVQHSKKIDVPIFYTGPKHFGYNFNWLARVPDGERDNLFNPLLDETIQAERKFNSLIPEVHRISILNAISKDGAVQITDGQGMLLSPDRTHLTKYGAILIGERAISGSVLGNLIESLLARNVARSAHLS